MSFGIFYKQLIVGNILSLFTFILIACLQLFLQYIIFAIREASYEQDAMQFTPILAILWKFLQSGKLHEIKIFKITDGIALKEDFPKINKLLSLKFNIYEIFIKT